MIGAAGRTRMRLVSHCAAKPLRTGAAFARGTRLPAPRPPGPYSMCGRGGTGRRAALRSLWPKGRGSSSLLDRTNPLKAKDFSEGLAQFGTLPFPEYAVKRSKRGGGWADSGLLNYRMMRGPLRQFAAGSRPFRPLSERLLPQVGHGFRPHQIVEFGSREHSGHSAPCSRLARIALSAIAISLR